MEACAVLSEARGAGSASAMGSLLEGTSGALGIRKPARAEGKARSREGGSVGGIDADGGGPEGFGGGAGSVVGGRRTSGGGSRRTLLAGGTEDGVEAGGAALGRAAGLDSANGGAAGVDGREGGGGMA